MNACCREKSLTVLAAILFNSAGCDSNVKRDGPRYAITASEVAKQDLASESMAGGAAMVIVDPDRNLGDIPLRAHRETFVIHNNGLAVLKLFGLSKSCGCVEADVTPAVVEPGSVAQLSVLIRPTRTEHRSAVVIIDTNDPRAPISEVRLKWRSRGPVEVIPQEVDFEGVDGNSIVEKEFMVRVDFSQLSAPSCEPTWHIPTGRGLSIRKGMEVYRGTLRETIWSLRLEAGEDTGTDDMVIHGEFEACGLPKEVIRVRWSVEGKVRAEPPRLFLGKQTTAGATLEKPLTLFARDGHRVDVVKMEWKRPDSRLTIHPGTVDDDDEKKTCFRVRRKRPAEAGLVRVDCRGDSGLASSERPRCGAVILPCGPRRCSPDAPLPSGPAVSSAAGRFPVQGLAVIAAELAKAY
jgi:hypothetical protein